MRHTSVFVRSLTPEERQPLEGGLRSSEAFRVRRCQLVLASEYGARVPRIARQVRCSQQTVRNVVHAFTTQGVACLLRGSSRPHTTRERLGSERAERLQVLLPQSPRTFGHPTSLWTLELAAEVSLAQGLTTQRVSRAAIRTARRRLEVSWQRAKRWITSPDPAYARKKKPAPACTAWRRAIRSGRWAVKETWWSRLAHPALPAWTPAHQPWRVIEQTVPSTAPDPKALACYGLLVQEQSLQGSSPVQGWLRFVADRPVSAVTVAFLT
jgi:transposase